MLGQTKAPDYCGATLTLCVGDGDFQSSNGFQLMTSLFLFPLTNRSDRYIRANRPGEKSGQTVNSVHRE